jgi:hypothetical protein
MRSRTHIDTHAHIECVLTRTPRMCSLLTSEHIKCVLSLPDFSMQVSPLKRSMADSLECVLGL